MNYSQICDMLFMVMGGLTIFLLGMNNMSNGMQAVAGDRMRQLINAITYNRFMAIAVGFIVTAIIQSSSVTSVMTVGFVNAGLMTLVQAIGVILGADIGTTVTGWILVLKIGRYGLPLLGVAGLFYLFSKNERTRYIAMMFMGVGMVFFGLELMKNGFKPIRDIPEFLALFVKFSPKTVSGLILSATTGAVITAIIQSSSASVGIVMGMAVTGILDFETSIALVLGVNIGTTITAFLASLGTTPNAKRAAYGHTIIKIIGVVWALPMFPLFIKTIPIITGTDPGAIVMQDGVETFPHIIKGIAIGHTAFNIINVLLFVPFVPFFAKLLTRIVPDLPATMPTGISKLDIRMFDTPMLVIEQTRKEIITMGQSIQVMLEDLRDVLNSDRMNEDSAKRIFQNEERMDIIQKEISTFLITTISNEIPQHLVFEAQAQLRMTDEFESVSDYATSILKLSIKLDEAGVKMSSDGRADLLQLHDMVADYFIMVKLAITKPNKELMVKTHVEGNTITRRFREIRTKHLECLSNTKVEPLFSVSYMNMLNSYRRIKDHVENVAEVMAGQK
ncbi:MAG: Na/Pi cotransporter family protein [Deltaproteobacteria bacterium]|nr:Na/Pi cotransporter family protein [Deltaproteobacteria bacterium]